MQKLNYIKTPTHVFFISSYLSQWYPSSFQWDGLWYRNAEQYMMAEKARLMKDSVAHSLIMSRTDPRELKALGREIKNFDQELWDREKYRVVSRGTFLKFTQNPDLMKQILVDLEPEDKSTFRTFVECNANDKVWGIGLGMDSPDIYDSRKWQGENLLGNILSWFALSKLMEFRA